jgi:hypothetical protein
MKKRMMLNMSLSQFMEGPYVQINVTVQEILFLL